jgi:hypothetical protein
MAATIPKLIKFFIIILFLINNHAKIAEVLKAFANWPNFQRISKVFDGGTGTKWPK